MRLGQLTCPAALCDQFSRRQQFGGSPAAAAALVLPRQTVQDMRRPIAGSAGQSAPLRAMLLYTQPCMHAIRPCSWANACVLHTCLLRQHALAHCNESELVQLRASGKQPSWGQLAKALLPSSLRAGTCACLELSRTYINGTCKGLLMHSQSWSKS